MCPPPNYRVPYATGDSESDDEIEYQGYCNSCSNCMLQLVHT